MRLVDDLFDRTIDMLSEESKTVKLIFSRNRPKLFTKLSKDLSIRYMNITSSQEEAPNKKYTDLLKDFHKHVDRNP